LTAVAEAVLVLALVQGAADTDHRSVEIRITVTAMLLHVDGRADMSACSIGIAIRVLLACLGVVDVCFAAWASYIGCSTRMLGRAQRTLASLPVGRCSWDLLLE